ncbi:MAG: hypothetical protein LBJ98_04025, partial [Endomicrobium sp.]|nr:hypothetical protein [Endomicrobium sp.]
MKRAHITEFLILAAVFVFLTGCKTEPKNLASVPSVPSSGSPLASIQQVNPSSGSSPASIQQANPFYNGSGGKDISLAILSPQLTGLTENLNYLPALVQGELVSNFSGYSAISVLDRENLDKL